MPEDLTISAVSPQTNDWSNQHGFFRDFKVKFQQTGDDVAVIARKLKQGEGSATMKGDPAVGDSLYGHLEDQGGDHPPKFKADRKDGGSWDNQSGGGGGGMSPERETKIVRQHSQEMALRYFALMPGSLPGDEALLARINWFAEDAMGEAPSFRTADGDFEQAPVPADDDIPF